MSRWRCALAQQKALAPVQLVFWIEPYPSCQNQLPFVLWFAETTLAIGLSWQLHIHHNQRHFRSSHLALSSRPQTKKNLSLHHNIHSYFLLLQEYSDNSPGYMILVSCKKLLTTHFHCDSLDRHVACRWSILKPFPSQESNVLHWKDRLELLLPRSSRKILLSCTQSGIPW